MPANFDDCNAFYHYLLNQNRYLEKNTPSITDRQDIENTINSNSEMVVRCVLSAKSIATEFKKLKDNLDIS